MGMSRSQLVAEHLPLLRRYARALTGNQASGDAYVAAMLEALLQDSSLLDERHGHRAGLFKLFTQIWNSVSLNDNPDVATLALPPERRLSNITPLPRQAFLLLSLEGFSEEEVAFILSTDIPETRRLTDAAGREMAAEIATDVRARTTGTHVLQRPIDTLLCGFTAMNPVISCAAYYYLSFVYTAMVVLSRRDKKKKGGSMFGTRPQAALFAFRCSFFVLTPLHSPRR